MSQSKRGLGRPSIARSGVRANGGGASPSSALKFFASLVGIIDFALLLYALLGGSGIIDYAENFRANAELERELGELEARNRQLSREITLLKTDIRYLEQTVRHRLHFLRENEILYLFGGSAPQTGEQRNGKN